MLTDEEVTERWRW